MCRVLLVFRRYAPENGLLLHSLSDPVWLPECFALPSAEVDLNPNRVRSHMASDAKAMFEFVRPFSELCVILVLFLVDGLHA